MAGSRQELRRLAILVRVKENQRDQAQQIFQGRTQDYITAKKDFLAEMNKDLPNMGDHLKAAEALLEFILDRDMDLDA